MFKHLSTMVLFVALCRPGFAVDEQHGVVVGEVLKLDAVARTIVVKIAGGSNHTFRFLERTAVHGGGEAAAGSKNVFRGLKEGSQVVVHYSVKETAETAEEVDRIGDDGLKAMDVTVVHLDRGAKTLAVKTADGTEETVRLTRRAAMDAGEEIGKGAETSVKGTVYYTDESGRKLGHLFKSAF